MQPDELDAARLWDMLTYAREITKTAAGMTFDAYMADADRRLATTPAVRFGMEASSRELRCP